MRRLKMNIDKFRRAVLSGSAATPLLLIGGLASASLAQQTGQKTFSSPEEAATEFTTAAQGNDQKAMLDILGADGKQIISSGDDVEDAHDRADFVQRFKEMHRFVNEPDGTTTLYIGARNWPTPIPLVNRGGSWYFDVDAGKTEILYRRIGRNEMSTIHVCKELVASEREYFATHGHVYAQKIISDAGEHNGLFWKAADGEPQSPIGPLIASAAAEGYVKNEGEPPTPYRGYYYRGLSQQGKYGQGGATKYIVGGRMTEGFAFVAYPAEYKSSGVMSFIVSEDGAVYQKDLGEKTEALAKAMKEFNPDPSWRKAEEQQAERVSEPETKYQVGTIIAVETNRAMDAGPPTTGYVVSLRVGNMVYVGLYKPQYDTGTVPFEIGREFNVLVGENTVTINDILGNPFQVPILSRSTVEP
jgi:Protein of unknown function (DUF2950)